MLPPPSLRCQRTSIQAMTARPFNRPRLAVATFALGAHRALEFVLCQRPAIAALPMKRDQLDVAHGETIALESRHAHRRAMAVAPFRGKLVARAQSHGRAPLHDGDAGPT